MLARTSSYTTIGLEALPVDVEVDAAQGLPTFTIVGLPDQAVKEAKERIRAAILNSLYRLPSKRFTVNLAPADVKKEGGVFDLAMALGLLAVSGQLDPAALASVVVLGELALDGSVRPIRGTLPIALALRKRRCRLLVPAPNAPEAAVVDGLQLVPVRSLREAVEALTGTGQPAPCPSPPARFSHRRETDRRDDLDFADVKGQAYVKRALEVAVAGHHHALMTWTQYHSPLNASRE